MTIPMNNWCVTCEEACHDHPRVCTICGTTLQLGPSPSPSPATATTAAGSANNSTNNDFGQRDVVDDIRRANNELTTILGSLRGQVHDLDALTRNIIQQQQQQQGGQWQNVPAELLNPQNQLSSSNTSRPTSKQVLQSIPRIILNDKSTIFRQATLQIIMMTDNDHDDHDDETNDDDVNGKKNEKPAPATRTTLSFTCVVGEFGPTEEYRFESSTLHKASPFTGKGGLSKETIDRVVDSKQDQKDRNNNVILFMGRGDDVTFVQKAIMAQQQAHASAVIIGNNTSIAWPYIMKDSMGEAETFGLTIPTVMIKEEDSTTVAKLLCANKTLKCNLHVTVRSSDCVVCCDKFENGETVLQIPDCAHVFHETCAVAWLQSHNTCPYCRKELPTDDVEYEEARRRQQRTHATGGSASYNDRTTNHAADAFYG
jgi:hypothetical protein